MTDIDWTVVEQVRTGAEIRGKLSVEEKRMAARRLAHRVIVLADNNYAAANGKITAATLARRMSTTDRTIQRILSELPPADVGRCPVCHERAWVIEATGVIERHGNSLYQDCSASGQPMGPTAREDTLRGLATLRPDLYRWVS